MSGNVSNSLPENQVTSSPKEQDYFSDVFLKKKLFLKPFKGEMMIITHNHQLNGMNGSDFHEGEL